MSRFIPASGFKWIDPKQFHLDKDTSNSSKGCVLEVDLKYSNKLRESNNDYSLAPDKIEIKREMLSEYQLNIADLFNISIFLFDKEKYVLHNENLQLYVKLGLKLKKIHPVLEFNQSQWLKPYIEFNTEKNKEKDGKAWLYKLMNNAIYRKTMENLKNRINVKLISNKKAM